MSSKSVREMSWPWDSKAAVDERFYAQHQTAFTLTRSDTWRGPGFKVTYYGGGAAVMHVEKADLGNGGLYPLVLFDAASHEHMVAVKPSRFATRGQWQWQWEAFRGRGTDRLFVAVNKTGVLQMGITAHVFLHGDSSGDRVPDFVVHGSYLRGTLTVSRGGDGGEFIAQIRSRNLWLSAMFNGEYTYTVWINPGVDQAFVLALTVILDKMQRLWSFDNDECLVEGSLNIWQGC